MAASKSSKPKLYFTCMDKLLLVFSSCTYIADVGSDIFVAATFYMNGDIFYFVLTLMCVFIPSLIASIYSLACYLADRNNSSKEKPTSKQWAVRFVFFILQLSPLLRYYDSYVYGTLSNKEAFSQMRYEYAVLMWQEMLDASKLRLYEAYLEDGSQLILQLYIIARSFERTKPMQYIQYISVAISFLSMAGSTVDYMRNVRKISETSAKIRKRIIPIIEAWLILILISRLEAVALFASATRAWVGIFLCLHWSVMFCWSVQMKTSFFGGNLCKEHCYNAVIAYIQIFIFFNLKDSPTRYRTLFYYILFLVENTFLLVIWYHLTHLSHLFYTTAFAFHYATFAGGILLMVAYYLWFHPSENIPVWRVPPKILKKAMTGFSGSRNHEGSGRNMSPDLPVNGKCREVENTIISEECLPEEFRPLNSEILPQHSQNIDFEERVIVKIHREPENFESDLKNNEPECRKPGLLETQL